MFCERLSRADSIVVQMYDKRKYIQKKVTEERKKLGSRMLSTTSRKCIHTGLYQKHTVVFKEVLSAVGGIKPLFILLGADTKKRGE